MQTIERKICTALVGEAVRCGYSVSVWDGEAWPLKRSTDTAAILAAMGSTDEETLVLRTADGLRVGDIFLVYGNDGHDVISDHSLNHQIESLVSFAQAQAEG